MLGVYPEVLEGKDEGRGRKDEGRRMIRRLEDWQVGRLEVRRFVKNNMFGKVRNE